MNRHGEIGGEARGTKRKRAREEGCTPLGRELFRQLLCFLLVLWYHRLLVAPLYNDFCKQSIVKGGKRGKRGKRGQRENNGLTESDTKS
jgi:hypothetical protein